MKVLLGLVVTAHLGFSEPTNNVHPHLRVELPKSFVTGIYKNSTNKASIYIAKEFINSSGYFVDIGVVSGYNFTDSPVIPFLIAGKNYNNYTLFIAPVVDAENSKMEIKALVGLEYKFSLK